MCITVSGGEEMPKLETSVMNVTDFRSQVFGAFGYFEPAGATELPNPLALSLPHLQARSHERL